MNPQNNVIVDSLKESFSGAAASFIVQYQGCTCEELTDLRRNLRPVGARLAVIKNTLATRAVAGTAAEGLSEYLSGPTAVVWSKEDLVGPAKVIADFAKTQEKFIIRAGYIEGNVVGEAQIKVLAAMPSKEQLFAKLLALINTPATRLLQTINAPAATLVRLLAAVTDKKQEEQN